MYIYIYLSRFFLYVEGRLVNETSIFPNVSLSELETNFTNVRSGGQWSPSNCLARHKVIDI